MRVGYPSYFCVFTRLFDFAPLVMAYSLLASIGDFERTTELFSSYLERLNQFFIANDIGQCAADATDSVRQAADRKKVAVLISVMEVNIIQHSL